MEITIGADHILPGQYILFLFHCSLGTIIYISFNILKAEYISFYSNDTRVVYTHIST